MWYYKCHLKVEQEIKTSKISEIRGHARNKEIVYHGYFYNN